ncbi:MAG: zf-TFIIB domain-containing protein [Cyanobacteria bacterium]|nr:zf-TFIIB domain-containing protein [Cyanobacteriota bacterium]
MCNQPFLVLERYNIELDCCLQCQGVWFDAEEINLLATDQPPDLSPQMAFHAHGKMPHTTYKTVKKEKPDFLKNATPERNPSLKRLKCPRCKQKMQVLHPSHHNDLMLDVCVFHHGIWFDAGELETFLKLPERVASSSEESQHPLMGSVLAHIRRVFETPLSK